MPDPVTDATLDPEVQKIMDYAARKPGKRLPPAAPAPEQDPRAAAEAAGAVPLAVPQEQALSGGLVPAQPARAPATYHLDVSQSSYTGPDGKTYQGLAPSYLDRLDAGGPDDRFKAFLMRRGVSPQAGADATAPYLEQYGQLQGLQNAQEAQGLARGKLALEARTGLGGLGVAQAGQAQAAKESEYKMDPERLIEEAQKQVHAALLAKNGGAPVDPNVVEANNRAIRQMFAPSVARQGQGRGPGGQPAPGMPRSQVPAGMTANQYLDQQIAAKAPIPVTGDVINVGHQPGSGAAPGAGDKVPPGSGQTEDFLGTHSFAVRHGPQGADPVEALRTLHKTFGPAWLAQNWDRVTEVLRNRNPKADEALKSFAEPNLVTGALNKYGLTPLHAGASVIRSWFDSQGPRTAQGAAELQRAGLGEAWNRIRGKTDAEDELKHLVRLKTSGAANIEDLR